MTTCMSVTIDAPAKINLGLEILGMRQDGFHEIRSVMAMIELADTLHIFVDKAKAGTSVADVPGSDTLIARAIRAFHDAVPQSPQLGWTIDRRIPIAAGLGGSSSDAAAALIAANRIAGSPLERHELALLAASLGSDIPFFLGNPAAIASGRGTILEPLNPMRYEVLLMVPTIDIPEKTTSLYSLIRPEDYSDGNQANETRELLAGNRLPGIRNLRNAFSRPLASIEPRILDLHRALSSSGCDAFGLSGAGPAHFVLEPERCVPGLRDALAQQFGNWLTLIPTRTRLAPLRVTQSVSNV